MGLRQALRRADTAVQETKESVIGTLVIAVTALVIAVVALVAAVVVDQ